MQTKIINIKKEAEASYRIALETLSKGEIICFPTETVYGIGCSLFDEKAISKIFALKQRSFNKPLAAHIGKIEDIENLCQNIPDNFYLIAEKFLPGSLSIILEKKDAIPSIVTSGMNTLGIRFPDHDFLINLINSLGSPLAATSANISGKPFATDGEMAMAYFKNKIPLVLDDGQTKYMQESTVISLVKHQTKCLREGVIKKEQLEELLSVEFTIE